MSIRRKTVTQEEINQILFGKTDESDNSDCDASSTSEDEISNIDEVDDLEMNEENYETLVRTPVVKNEDIKQQLFVAFAGPVHNLPPSLTALHYFKLLFPDEFCESIRIHSNKYTEFCMKKKSCDDKNWEQIESVKEIWGYIAILLIMSIARVPKVSDYWSKNLIVGNEMIKKICLETEFFK
ncbi:hypothetical protein AVEN_197064-1 [Araneus ventricosus]|uniref:PiggyBac transposable element-derived protein domain-containing protein n=1 Tax=Araneus ventricosus TaxID=182803 RepID=A0A4Y2U658_ARAVE|nr:hypothetical protein AVEN_197064-1 [Araneus ventricosus]